MRKLKIASLPEVGLWWYYKNKVISYSIPYSQAEDQGLYRCVNVEHKNIWEEIKQDYLEEFPELLEMTFDQVPRGRVWYAPSGSFFTITCSENFMKNNKAIQHIKYVFGIDSREVRVYKDTQYPNLEADIR
jgi:hypothetical protein